MDKNAAPQGDMSPQQPVEKPAGPSSASFEDEEFLRLAASVVIISTLTFF